MKQAKDDYVKRDTGEAAEQSTLEKTAWCFGKNKKHLLDNGMHDLLDVVELGILQRPRT